MHRLRPTVQRVDAELTGTNEKLIIGPGRQKWAAHAGVWRNRAAKRDSLIREA